MYPCCYHRVHTLHVVETLAKLELMLLINTKEI